MGEVDLVTLEALRAQAAPGPYRVWEQDPMVGCFWKEALPEGSVCIETQNGIGALGQAVGAGTDARNARWIIAACNAVPALIAELRERRRASAPTEWFGVWASRDGYAGHWHQHNRADLETTRTEAERTAKALNEHAAERTDSLGWRYEVRSYVAAQRTPQGAPTACPCTDDAFDADCPEHGRNRPRSGSAQPRESRITLDLMRGYQAALHGETSVVSVGGCPDVEIRPRTSAARPVRVGDRLVCSLMYGDGFKPDTVVATFAHTTDPAAHRCWKHEDGTAIKPFGGMVKPTPGDADEERAYDWLDEMSDVSAHDGVTCKTLAGLIRDVRADALATPNKSKADPDVRWTQNEAKIIETAFQLRAAGVFDGIPGDTTKILNLKAEMQQALDGDLRDAADRACGVAAPCASVTPEPGGPWLACYEVDNDRAWLASSKGAAPWGCAENIDNAHRFATQDDVVDAIESYGGLLDGEWFVRPVDAQQTSGPSCPVEGGER